MMNVCFISSDSTLAIGRAAMSEGPPGGHGTMIVTGLVGYACANAPADAAASTIAPSTATMLRLANFMVSFSCLPGVKRGCSAGPHAPRTAASQSVYSERDAAGALQARD